MDIVGFVFLNLFCDDRTDSETEEERLVVRPPLLPNRPIACFLPTEGRQEGAERLFDDDKGLICSLELETMPQ